MDFGYVYDPSNISSDQFLSDIPVSLMKENIKAQFADPLEYNKKDFISPFINMYKYSMDNREAYDDDGEEYDFNDIRNDFYIFIQNMIMDYLGIGFIDFGDRSIDEQDHLIHYVYRFFITNIRKNFVTFIFNKIQENKDDYIYDEEKKKDVASLSFKKEITDPKDIYILSNIHSIITEILYSEDIDIDEFLEKCDNDGSLETQFVIEQYDNLTITGNFIDKYIEMLNTTFISDIETKIRNKILKKYR